VFLAAPFLFSPFRNASLPDGWNDFSFSTGFFFYVRLVVYHVFSSTLPGGFESSSAFPLVIDSSSFMSV